jgi:hypothetical protein
VLARAGSRFTGAEVGILRGMARVLALGLRLLGTVAVERRHVEENRDLVDSLQQRQALLERLAQIQRRISSRTSLQHVLDAITSGAAELLGDEVVALRLIDESDPDFMVLVSSIGIPTALDATILDFLSLLVSPARPSSRTACVSPSPTRNGRAPSARLPATACSRLWPRLFISKGAPPGA